MAIKIVDNRQANEYREGDILVTSSGKKFMLVNMKAAKFNTKAYMDLEECMVYVPSNETFDTFLSLVEWVSANYGITDKVPFSRVAVNIH